MQNPKIDRKLPKFINLLISPYLPFKGMPYCAYYSEPNVLDLVVRQAELIQGCQDGEAARWQRRNLIVVEPEPLQSRQAEKAISG